MEKDAVACCDNFYIGNVITMYLLAEHFYKNMDDILSRYTNICHQEMLVHTENDRIFDGNNVLSKHMAYTKKNTMRKKKYTRKIRSKSKP